MAIAQKHDQDSGPRCLQPVSWRKDIVDAFPPEFWLKQESGPNFKYSSVIRFVKQRTSFFQISISNLHHLCLFLLTHTTGFQPRPRPPARRKRTLNSYGFGRCSRGGKAATTTPVRTPPTRMNSNWRGGTLGIKLSAKSL